MHTHSNTADAFLGLLQPSLPRLNRFTRSLARNPFDAEDIAQEAILKAFQHKDQFRLEGTFKSWLMGIAFNEFLQIRRKHKPGRVVQVDRSDLEQLAQPDPAMSASTRCESDEKATKVRWAVSRLPQKYRVVVELRDLEGWSIAETATHLSMSVSAIKSRHHRARIELRRLLDHRRHSY
jgi:RNA polymerase sigma-70 factor (ECF subfamily)